MKVTEIPKWAVQPSICTFQHPPAKVQSGKSAVGADWLKKYSTVSVPTTNQWVWYSNPPIDEDFSVHYEPTDYSYTVVWKEDGQQKANKVTEAELQDCYVAGSTGNVWKAKMETVLKMAKKKSAQKTDLPWPGDPQYSVWENSPSLYVDGNSYTTFSVSYEDYTTVAQALDEQQVAINGDILHSQDNTDAWKAKAEKEDMKEYQSDSIQLGPNPYKKYDTNWAAQTYVKVEGDVLHSQDNTDAWKAKAEAAYYKQKADYFESLVTGNLPNESEPIDAKQVLANVMKYLNFKLKGE